MVDVADAALVFAVLRRMSRTDCHLRSSASFSPANACFTSASSTLSTARPFFSSVLSPFVALTRCTRLFSRSVCDV